MTLSRKEVGVENFTMKTPSDAVVASEMSALVGLGRSAGTFVGHCVLTAVFGAGHCTAAGDVNVGVGRGVASFLLEPLQPVTAPRAITASAIRKLRKAEASLARPV